ncbi:DUF3471 domain-containing protein [Pseudoalteromonas byunsanensis]|uniref:MBL fold metallo-hydrolase n=1 Tax=Pseudoalteromonas byunsanensis TaxID=327939 RepID=A0A1S1N2X2_9GAMM|nr:DUF3471 domain-containing protein [Pseudoalteromonas byunsanensis]OHU94026.1 hypothetical protein BIW53_17555 [Pseudoalteromonas byunsanensis]
MNFKRMLLVVTLALLATQPLFAKNQPNYATSKLNDQVYVITQIWNGNNNGNAGVVIGPNGVMLIGSLMASSAPYLAQEIKKLTNKPIKFVINIDSDPYNHHANQYFAEQGATIIAHENMRYEKAYTELLFKQQISIAMGNETVTAYHSPTHQLNHIDVHLENSNVIFMSDGFKGHWLTPHGPNGLKGVLESFDKALELANDKTIIVTGNTSKNPTHYVRDKATLIKVKQLHIDFTERVGTLYQKGMTAEQIAQDDVINILLKNFSAYSTAKRWIPDEIAMLLESDFIQPYPLTHAQLMNYTGNYLLDDGTKVEVLLEGNRLFARSPGSFMFELTAQSKEVFDFKAVQGKNQIRFNFSQAGHIQSLTTELEDNGWWASRIKAGTHIKQL